MKKITTALKFPFTFNEEKLLKDLELISQKKWIPHFNQSGYDGAWKVLSLYAPDSDESNILAIHNEDKEIKKTALLQNCDYLNEVIESFECPVITARLLNLNVGSKIKTHSDYNLGYEDDIFRIHVPIITNDGVTFILDEEQIKMNVGECWYTNVNYPHSVTNNGEEDRIHLVIDYQRNQWSDDLFFSLAPKESFEPETNENYSAETLREMIEALSIMNEPVAKTMIEDLKSRLGELLKSTSK